MVPASGAISPRFDVGVKEVEGWTSRLLLNGMLNKCVASS